MKNTFKKGLILGGLLAAGAVVGLAMTKEGKELSDDLQKDLKILAKHLKKSLHAMEDVTKENFDTLVATVVEEYAKKKVLANDAKKALVSALEATWHDMEDAYHAQGDEK